MWLDPPGNLTLNEEEVHLWRANLEVDEYSKNSFLKLLSPDEKARAQKFRFGRDNRNFIVARGILRSLMGSYLKTDPAEIAFQYSEFGKPSSTNNDALHFNISHSENLALFAFTKKMNIGVDVEFVNPDIEIKELATNFFSPNEALKLFSLPRQQHTLAFYNCWTRKEAFIKAVGEGLSFPLNSFEVSLEPDKPAALLATHWDPTAVSKWSVYSMTPAENFVGSVIVEGVVTQVKFWNWHNY